MTRSTSALGWCSLLIVVVGWGQLWAQGADRDKAVKNELFLQEAMVQANQFLFDAKPGKAVQVLEEHLPRVAGNANFLNLLRKSYRAYITQLWLAHQPELARRYLERLCVLEPGAVSDPSLRPPDATEKRGVEYKPEPVAEAKLPKYKAEAIAKGPGTDTSARPPVVRAHSEDPDPFDLMFRRPDPERDTRVKLASLLLNRAEDHFANCRFAEARQLYEQAFEADRGALARSKDRYAYCLLNGAVEELNRPGLAPAQLAVLQTQVEGAILLAPKLPKLVAEGNDLLRQIRERNRGADATFGSIAIQHLGRNKEGWNVTETPHFRIFHHQGPELAEKAARIAEQTRLAMARKWFGNDGETWSPKCELILHETGEGYHKMTGVAATAPGHSRIESDPSGRRVVSRRMDLRLDFPGMLEAVLPHETTHVVLAGMFDGQPVPRWADEGIAVLSEPEEKIKQHRRNLDQSAKLGQTFKLKELLELSDYPQPRRIPAFYAQSVFVVDFLSKQKGPVAFTTFVRDGLRDGYESALRRHYGWDYAAFEQHWQDYLTGEIRTAAK